MRLTESLPLSAFGPAAPAQFGKRPFPAPYRAMLAICSDLDETPDAETYFELMRFLNTHEETSMGPGVGLEVGNTMYFDMPPGQFSYWNTTEESREKIRILIRSGHIDCLHSFGDLATTRAHAGRALDELARHDCRIRVWVDHAQAPTNFGADIMRGHGDQQGHPAYHADLSTAYGIEHVWRGRTTSVIGQDQPATLRGIANWRYPLLSASTLGRETAKQILARMGSQKYHVHGGNQLVTNGSLRDGQPIHEFLRCSPHWAGISGADNADGIAEVLGFHFLEWLVARNAVCILYTHLGKTRRNRGLPPFCSATVAAFRRLAEYYHDGRICVTTTARLLDYRTRGSAQGTCLPWSRLQFPELP